MPEIFYFIKSLWWPFGIKLIISLTNLLFFPGFTIDSTINFQDLAAKQLSKQLTAYPIPMNENILWYPFHSSGKKENNDLLENR